MTGDPPRRPVRVGFVLHVMQVAGAEVLTREMIRRLGPRIRPTVFCLDAVGRIGEEMIRDDELDLVCLGRKPGRDFGVSRRLAAEVSRRRLDVVHAHQYTPFFYAALAKPLCRPSPRLILTEHGRHYPDLVSPVRRAVNRLVLDRFADAVTACCQFSRDGLSRNDGFAARRIEVIANGIEVDRYGPPTERGAYRERLGLHRSRRLVAHVARHHPVKDQPTLIRGFASIADRLPDVDLMLAGDGPLRGELETLVESLGVRDRVKFLGIRSDVPDVLRAADAFALTSVSEAASLTLIEAMATGLPVIVSAVGGNGELARDGVEGLHFPRGDWRACGDALFRLLSDPDLATRLGAGGLERARAEFRLDRAVEKYYQLYRTLTGL